MSVDGAVETRLGDEFGWRNLLALPEVNAEELVQVAPMLPVAVMVLSTDVAGGFDQPPENPRQVKAYDAGRDVARFEELKTLYGTTKAREMFLQETFMDLLTHFQELDIVNGFLPAFRYVYEIQDGELVENSTAKAPVRKMFETLNDPASFLWKRYLIEGLEKMPPGATVFFLSSRLDGSEYEGAFDFIYLLHKVSENTVEAYGLGLDLSAEQRVGIVNRQMIQSKNYLHMLTENALAEDIRSRAIFYPSGRFIDAFEAYEEIVSVYTGYSMQEIERIFEESEQRSKKHTERAMLIAPRMLATIEEGGDVQRVIKKAQVDLLWEINPTLMNSLIQLGERGVMLPCGWVDFGLGVNSMEYGILSFSLGISEYNGPWKMGDCVVKDCGRKGVLVGDCGVCQQCQREFDLGLRH